MVPSRESIDGGLEFRFQPSQDPASYRLPSTVQVDGRDQRFEYVAKQRLGYADRSLHSLSND